MGVCVCVFLCFVMFGWCYLFDFLIVVLCIFGFFKCVYVCVCKCGFFNVYQENIR